jgi:hypothetical protein
MMKHGLKNLVLFAISVVSLTSLLLWLKQPAQVPPAEAHTYSGAPTFTTWAPNQTLTSTTLNNSLAHMHNTFSGNIDDTMINAAASIQHSKFQYPALVPKAWALTPFCNSGTCTVTESSRISTIVRSGAGDYLVTLAYTAVNSNYYVMASGNIDNAGTPNPVICFATTKTTTTFHVKCSSSFTFAAADSSVNLLLFDADN